MEKRGNTILESTPDKLKAVDCYRSEKLKLINNELPIHSPARLLLEEDDADVVKHLRDAVCIHIVL